MLTARNSSMVMTNRTKWELHSLRSRKVQRSLVRRVKFQCFRLLARLEVSILQACLVQYMLAVSTPTCPGCLYDPSNWGG